MEIIILGKIKLHLTGVTEVYESQNLIRWQTWLVIHLSNYPFPSCLVYFDIGLLSSQLDCNSRLQRFALCVVGTGAIDPLPLQHHLHPPYYRWSPQTSLLIYCKMFDKWHGERNQAVPVVNYVRLCFVISTIDIETSRLSFITLQCLVFSHTKA